MNVVSHARVVLIVTFLTLLFAVIERNRLDQRKPKGTKAEPAEAKIAPQTYQALITHWNQQNTLIWSRVQTVIAIQVVIIAAVFSQEKNNQDLALVIGIAGAVLTSFVGCTVLNDRYSRDANLGILDRYAEHEGLYVRLKGPDRENLPWWKQLIFKFGNHRVLEIIILVLVILDLVLAPVMGAFPGSFALKQ